MSADIQSVRVQGGIYDREKPGYLPDPDSAGRCSYLAPVKYAAPGLAVIDHGAKIGRKVYHVPSDGTPGLVVPAWHPQTHRRVPGLVDGSQAGFRTLKDARAYMEAVSATGILPTDRAATAEEVRALAVWLGEHTAPKEADA